MSAGWSSQLLYDISEVERHKVVEITGALLIDSLDKASASPTMLRKEQCQAPLLLEVVLSRTVDSLGEV